MKTTEVKTTPLQAAAMILTPVVLGVACFVGVASQPGSSSTTFWDMATEPVVRLFTN